MGQHSFVGVTERQLELDPLEYAGMSVPRITEEIERILKSIAPDVDFFHQDIVMAADELHTRAQGDEG